MKISFKPNITFNYNPRILSQNLVRETAGKDSFQASFDPFLQIKACLERENIKQITQTYQEFLKNSVQSNISNIYKYFNQPLDNFTGGGCTILAKNLKDLLSKKGLIKEAYFLHKINTRHYVLGVKTQKSELLFEPIFFCKKPIDLINIGESNKEIYYETLQKFSKNGVLHKQMIGFKIDALNKNIMHQTRYYGSKANTGSYGYYDLTQKIPNLPILYSRPSFIFNPEYKNLYIRILDISDRNEDKISLCYPLSKYFQSKTVDKNHLYIKGAQSLIQPYGSNQYKAGIKKISEKAKLDYRDCENYILKAAKLFYKDAPSNLY